MRASLITATLFASIVVAGCGSKQKTKSEVPRSTVAPTKRVAPKPAKVVRATGEAREALIHLRRVHFAFDSATLLPGARTALQEAADHLQAVPAVQIYIDGHTDARGTTEYNLALGDQRARAVRDYLMDLGIAPERLHVVTFGKEKPWANGRSEVAYAKNRRAEFRLMRGKIRLMLDDGELYNDKGETMAAAH